VKRGRVLIPCRHAHQLLSERMDRPLGTGDRLRLWLHLRICHMCARIERQMDFIRSAMQRLGH
jgi:hypothetical protein